MANEIPKELKLPTTSVDPRSVTQGALARLPKDIAREFQAVFFKETDTELSLGIVHPELLKAGAKDALNILEKQVGKRIRLYKITESDFKQVFVLYEKGAQVVEQKPVTSFEKSADHPTHYKMGDTVSDTLLTKVPLEYAQKYRLVAVDQGPGDIVWFAQDKASAMIDSLLNLLARRNRINVKKITVSREEIDRLLNVTQAIFAKNVPITNDQVPDEVPDEKPVETEKGGNEYGPKGKIITGQVEKAGFAGLLQRAATAFSSNNEDAAKTAVNNGQLKPSIKVELAKKSETGKTQEPEKKLSMPKKEVVEAPQKEAVPFVKDLAGVDEEKKSRDSKVDILFKRPVTDVNQLQSILRSGNMPRMVAGIINYAVYSRASDVHIEPYDDEMLVRYRVDGQLAEVVKLPISIQPAMISRIKILSKLKLDESRVPQDGRFDVVASGDREVDIRVSTLPTVHGEKAVLRLLDKSEGIYTLEKLGLTGEGFNVLVESIKRAYGVVLSTGPTGSGKTTTLYAVLQRVATTNVNVVTLEDPVEYEMPGINQSQIKPKIGFTFADGLRSVLRQDPNIIMVGEIRDVETASMVTHAALTGHLVLSTLHTNDASGALPRLVNMGVEPFLITSSINAIVGQRLVRRLCPDCQQKVELPATIRSEIDAELELIRKINPKEASRIPDKIEFHRPGSCENCTSGYKGRVGLFEVLAMSDVIEDLAVKKATADDIKKAAMSKGMITMKQDGILKVLSGTTSLDEVLRETSSR